MTYNKFLHSASYTCMHTQGGAYRLEIISAPSRATPESRVCEDETTYESSQFLHGSYNYGAHVTQASYENACACSLRGNDVIPVYVNWGMML